MQTKTSQVVEKFRNGDTKGALRIISKFRRLTEVQIETFRMGYEVMVHRSFYRQIHGNQWCDDMMHDATVMLNEWVNEVEMNGVKKSMKINTEFDQLVFIGG